MYRLIAFAILCFASGPALARTWPSSLPDPCIDVRDRGAREQVPLGIGGGVGSWNVSYPEAFLGTEDELSALVFSVNANGSSLVHDQRLADHLARQNYDDADHRSAGRRAGDVRRRERHAATFAHFALPADFPVVLIGHSMGGGGRGEVMIDNIEAVYEF